MEELYFDHAMAKVFYHPTLDCIFLEYKSKVPTYSDFLLINEKLLSCFRHYNTQKVVADIRKLGIISPQWQQWVAEMLLPEMVHHLKGKPLIHAQLFDKNDIMVKHSVTCQTGQIGQTFGTE